MILPAGMARTSGIRGKQRHGRIGENRGECREQHGRAPREEARVGGRRHHERCRCREEGAAHANRIFRLGPQWDCCDARRSSALSARWTVEPEESGICEDLCCKFHIKQNKDGGGHFDFHGVYEDEMINARRPKAEKPRVYQLFTGRFPTDVLGAVRTLLEDGRAGQGVGLLRRLLLRRPSRVRATQFPGHPRGRTDVLSVLSLARTLQP